MRRPRIPLKERLELLRLIKERERQNDEQRRIYNKEFRKGRFFIVATVVRALYIVTLVIAYLIHFESKSYHEETVTSESTYTYMIHSKRSSTTTTELTFQTDHGKYCVSMSGRVSSPIESGDRVFIERNVLGRAIFFKKAEWKYKYRMDFPVLFYYAILFITLISAFFHDGTSWFVLSFLKIIIALNIIAILAYFLDLY